MHYRRPRLCREVCCQARTVFDHLFKQDSRTHNTRPLSRPLYPPTCKMVIKWDATNQHLAHRDSRASLVYAGTVLWLANKRTSVGPKAWATCRASILVDQPTQIKPMIQPGSYRWLMGSACSRWWAINWFGSSLTAFIGGQPLAAGFRCIGFFYYYVVFRFQNAVAYVTTTLRSVRGLRFNVSQDKKQMTASSCAKYRTCAFTVAIFPVRKWFKNSFSFFFLENIYTVCVCWHFLLRDITNNNICVTPE